MDKNIFETLNKVNCNEHTEKKNGLTYLSWAWAWAEVKKAFPGATYTIYERENGIPYFTDGRTCWVKTGVTIEGLEHIEYLPIMDFKNNSIPLDKVTSFDMNKAIQRSLTKACARHGLGLYIYAGEDLPEEGKVEDKKPAVSPAVKARREAADRNPIHEVKTDPVPTPTPAPESSPNYQPLSDDDYWKIVKAYAEGRKAKDGSDLKDTWILKTHAGWAEVAQFDNHVESYKTVNNLK